MCDRRITNGKIDNGRKYMVYLLNSVYSENQPEAWLCGGVLISHVHVLTSAACLTEVSHMYVIAGYKKYVSSKDIEKDNCTRTKKQKIVKIIIPKAFNGSTWMQYDVGLGVVEKSYNFLDVSFRKVCSYEPGSILINYKLRKEATKSPVIALGWGAAYAREPGMIGDTNSKYLRQTHTMITNATYCRKQFPKDTHTQKIDYMFLCTHNQSVVVNKKEAETRFVKREKEINSSSTRLITRTTPGRYFKEMWRCHGKKFGSNETPTECLDLDSGEPSLWRRRLSLNSTTSRETNNTFDGEKWDVNRTISRKQGKEKIGINFAKVGKNSGKEGKNFGKAGINVEKEGMNFGGICQNDHGGPLILPDGPTEMVIGIALNSVYNKNYQCKGPFLYLSTARAENLIKCLRSGGKTVSPKNLTLCSNNYEVREFDVIWPTSPSAPVQEVIKNCKNGECVSPEQRELLNIESDEPISVQPIPVRQKSNLFNMGFQYKRPNLDLNFLHTRHSFNMGMFTTRPTF